MTLHFFHEFFRRWQLCLVSLVAALSLFIVTSASESSAQDDKQETPQTQRITLPFADAVRGRQLFVGKGCVICHAINGVGGEVGPSLDADKSMPYVDVFDFAARMWRGAAIMVLLQEMEINYQIDLDGEDLAHLAAFVANKEEQSKFSQRDIPDLIKDWVTDKETSNRLNLMRDELRGIAQ